jgi:hypothetical protein
MKLLLSILFFTSLSAHAADNVAPTRILNIKPISNKQAHSQCVAIELGDKKLDCVDCKVIGIDDLGKVGTNHLAIARYEYSWGTKTGLKTCGYGAVLLNRDSKTSELQPVWGGLSEVSPTEMKKPKIIKNKFGTFIQIPIRMQGTGNFQDDGILSFQNGSLHELDTKSLEADLKSRLSPGLGLTINKGLYPNFERMTVDSDVWKKEDPNCCPTGGKIHATLSLLGDKFVVKSFTMENVVKR